MNEIANLCERVGRRRRRRAPRHRLRTAASAITSSFPASATAARASRRTCRRSSAPRTRHGMEFPLLNAVEEVNEAQKHVLVREGRRASSARSSRGARFAVWGLAFKPRTDDMREAPSIVDHRGAARSAAPTSRCTIPRRSTRRRKVFGERVNYHRVNYDALEGADALLIVTEWNEFRRPGLRAHEELMRQSGDLRRPQPLRARRHARARLHLLPDRPRCRASCG